MSKKILGKILPIVFLVCIIYGSYVVLINNVQQIKGEYGIRKIEGLNASGQKTQNSNEYSDIDTNDIDLHKRLMRKEEKKYGTNRWKSIERKDSYNNELQFYSKDNVVIKGDVIEITSKKEDRGDKMYTSGLVESAYAYQYGYFEFIIEISEGKGIFPAIWFLPVEDSEVLEIDLFEMIGSEPYTFYGVIHFVKDGKQDSDYFEFKVPIKEHYSVSIAWKSESITWYIDNQEIYTTSQGVPQEHMYIIINQAIGGNWPGDPDDTIFPNQFKVIASKIQPVFKKGRN